VAGTVKDTLIRQLKELQTIDPEERLKQRYQKFRNIGEFIENPTAA
jgi:acetyl-CoA carboxylase alpha subunit